MQTKYQAYKAKAKTLQKIVDSIELMQGGAMGANTIDLSPDGNYRLRLIKDDAGKIEVFTERYIKDAGFCKV